MARTNSTLVQELLSYNYDGASSLSPYITLANSAANQLSIRAAVGRLSITEADLTIVETWLSAYFYCTMDPLYKMKKTDRASGAFFERSYKDGAIAADPTGYLELVLKKPPHAGGVWLGKTESEERTYGDRMG